MKRICRIVAMVQLMLLASLLTAQHAPKISLTGSLNGALHSTYKMALEWQHNENMIFDLTAGIKRYNSLQKDVFNGIKINEYALRRTYSTGQGSTSNENESKWGYLGDGRPIQNPLQESITLLSNLRLCLGFKIYYDLSNKMAFFMEPAISTARYQTYEVNKLEHLFINHTIEDWRIGATSSEVLAVTETKYLTDSQRMQFKNYWGIGPACLFGLGWHGKKGIVVEARTHIGIEFGKSIQKLSDTLAEIQNSYAQFDVMIGYCFGK